MKLKNSSWRIRSWNVPQLDGVELTHGANLTHAYPRHVHHDHCIVIMLRGEEVNHSRLGTFRASAGNLMLVNAEEAHSSETIDAEYRMINIRPSIVDRLATEITGRKVESFRFSQPVVKDPSTVQGLLSIHEDLEQHLSFGLAQQTSFVIAISRLLRLSTGVPLSRSSQIEKNRVVMVREYIRCHYAERITLTELSSVAELSPFHLVRTFREYVGVPPHEYQIHVRINQARILLRGGESIADAALKVGFFDQSHFSRNFRRITGMTPGYYSSYSNIVQ